MFAWALIFLAIAMMAGLWGIGRNTSGDPGIMVWILVAGALALMATAFGSFWRSVRRRKRTAGPHPPGDPKS